MATGKPSILVVRTNLNWQPSLFQDSLERQIAADLHPDLGPRRQLDIFFPHYEGSRENKAQRVLAEELKRIGKPLVPHVELAYPLINYCYGYLGYCLCVGLGEDFQYEQFRAHLLLTNGHQHDKMDIQSLPEGFTHFDLIIDYVSNHDRFRHLLAPLAGDFDVQRLDIIRENLPREQCRW